MTYTRYPGLFVRRKETDSSHKQQADYFTQVHSSLNNDFLGTKTAIEVIDSHRAYSYYNTKRDTIVLDTHFFDYLRVVTAAFISGKSEYMDVLVNACAADYFLCVDEIHLSLRYANDFAREKVSVEKVISEHTAELKKHFYRQLLFVLSHEQGHALLTYNTNDERFKPYRYFFDIEYNRLVDASKVIQSIDLSSIKDDLDGLKGSIYEEPFNYSERDVATLFEHISHFGKVYQNALSSLSVAESNAISREDAIFYACDCYIKGSDVKTLDRSLYENECIIDGYTLQRLISCNIENEDIITQMKDAVFAYYSCLLTTDLVSCVNSCVTNIGSEGYNAEDLVWNRVRLEREMLNNLIQQYAFRKPHGFHLATELFRYSNMLAKQFSNFYARFCDRMFAIEHPTENTPYCPVGTTEYDNMYYEIYSLLKMNC